MTSLRIKLLLVGDDEVGKQSLCHTFYKNQSLEKLNCTLPLAFNKFMKMVLVDEYLIYLFVDILKEIEDYKRFIQFCGKNAILLCFSINNPQTLRNIKHKWIREVKHYCPKVPIVLVGTKADTRGKDLESNEVLVDKSDAYAFAEEIGASAYVECSTHNFTSIQKTFTTTVQEVIKYVVQ